MQNKEGNNFPAVTGVALQTPEVFNLWHSQKKQSRNKTHSMFAISKKMETILFLSVLKINLPEETRKIYVCKQNYVCSLHEFTKVMSK